MPSTCCRKVHRDRITIQQDSSFAGDQDPDYSGAEFAVLVPCTVKSVKGQESYRGQQLAASVDYVIELWRYPGITPDMRVVISGNVGDGKTANIEYVKEIAEPGVPMETWIFCRELVL